MSVIRHFVLVWSAVKHENLCFSSWCVVRSPSSAGALLSIFHVVWLPERLHSGMNASGGIGKLFMH